MSFIKFTWIRRLVPIFCACGLLALPGCGSRFKLFPVAGKVMLNGEPLTA